MMQTIGHARISTGEQALDRQRAPLHTDSSEAFLVAADPQVHLTVRGDGHRQPLAHEDEFDALGAAVEGALMEHASQFDA